MAHTTTVAEQALNDCVYDQFFDAQYPPSDLVTFALKILYLSYPEAYPSQLREPFQHQELFSVKEDEYLKTVCPLFGIDPDQRGWLPGIWTDVYNRNYRLVFAVKRFQGRHLSQDLSFSVSQVVAADDLREMGRTDLDHSSEVQSYKCVEIMCPFPAMVSFRRDNQLFAIQVNARHWDQAVRNQRLKTFDIGFGRIHPEGFQQWVEFGRGVRLLIEFTYKVMPEQGDEPSIFHLQTIFYMLYNRLELMKYSATYWHKHRTGLTRTTCMRPLVDAGTDSMYWRKTEDRVLDAYRQWAQTPSKRPEKPIPREAVQRLVPYIDLQRSLIYGEDLDENVCLCSQWCNWSAFFHFHPIYRFVIVMNSQLFINNHFNRSEIYLFSAILHVNTYGGVNPLSKAYHVLQLIRSANHYREIDRQTVLGQNQQSRYNTAAPNPDLLTATSYKHLRYDVSISALCQQLDSNPFDEICVRNLIDIYNVMESLHTFVGTLSRFVLRQNRIEWLREFNSISRAHIKAYVGPAIDKFFDPTNLPFVRVPQVQSDRLFSADDEYLHYTPKTEEERIIKYKKLYALTSASNIFNVVINVGLFVKVLFNVYKFSVQIDIKLTKPEQKSAHNDISSYWTHIDEAFARHFTTQPNGQFTIGPNQLENTVLKNTEANLCLFYTLKLYSIAWYLQNQCIMGRAGLLNFDVHLHTHIANHFQFFFNYSPIEETVRNTFNMPVFEISDRLEALFNDFYNFWGQPTHELNAWNPSQRPLFQFADSAFGQYERLFVWLTNGGPYRPKFYAIVEEFDDQFKVLYDRNDEIFCGAMTPIYEYFFSNNYDYCEEVMDVLALNLCRGHCFCMNQMVATLFRLMHGLQNTQHCDQEVAYSLGKPGWTELFATIECFGAHFSELLHLYVIFDDELERISETFSKTRIAIKKFYLFLYYKLSWEWHKENVKIANFVTANPQVPSHLLLYNNLMILQTAVGISFSVRFVDHFRYVFRSLRKSIYNFYRIISNNPRYANNFQRFRSCLLTVRDYMTDRQAVISGKPFETTQWEDYINQLFPDLMRLTPQDVALDMVEADQVI